MWFRNVLIASTHSARCSCATSSRPSNKGRDLFLALDPDFGQTLRGT